MEEAADTLFDEIFLDVFINQDDEIIDRENFDETVNVKLADDLALRDMLLAQFDVVDKDQDGFVDQEGCKAALTYILKDQMERILVEKEQAMEIRTEEAFKSGLYAKETVGQVLNSYKESVVSGDDETFMHMADLFELFYNDSDMNTSSTLVRGVDFCEMLALFFDLSEAVRNFYITKL